MEILEILEKNQRDLYLEDLDFFETELATGEYSPEYIKLCRDKIGSIRLWLEGGEDASGNHDNDLPENLVVGIDALAPKVAGGIITNMTDEERALYAIKQLREASGYKTEFKKFVKENDIIDEAFVEKHFSFFTELELDALMMVVAFSEDFLEKYFGAFDKDKIARYQCFSEAFFMKHYADLDATIVLTSGKNEWRDKAKRSRQLDVFLRLKGINI